MSDRPAPPEVVYKIFRLDEWEQFEKTGSFDGSNDDKRDGFIHLSCEEQLEGTLEKHYQGIREVVLAQVKTAGLPIEMEVSRGGALFPHLYGSLPWSHITNSQRRRL